MSCTFTRTCSPVRRTLPSSKMANAKVPTDLLHIVLWLPASRLIVGLPTASLRPCRSRSRSTISVEAFEAIARTPPLGSVGYEAEASEQGQRLIRLEDATADLVFPPSATVLCSARRG